MAVKIKISFTDPEELKKILALLRPIIKNQRISKNQEGKYKKAYVELNI